MAKQGKSFWTTIPGVLTGLAGLITAVGTLLGILYSQGVIGHKTCEVPDVVGLRLSDAESELSRVTCGIHMVETSKASARFDEGQVIRTDPAKGSNMSEGSLVRVYFSSGPPPPAECPVPDLVGKDSATAVNLLGSSDCFFRPTVIEQQSATVSANYVIGTKPPVGTLARAGSTVTLYVSSGVELVVVPDVTGLTGTQATEALTRLGLMVKPSESRLLAGIPEKSDSVKACNVTRTEPPATTRVPKGTEVQLYVASPGAGSTYCGIIFVTPGIFVTTSPTP